MIKRPTWMMLAILAISIAAFILLKNHNPTSSLVTTPTALGNGFLVTPADGKLQILRLSDKNNHVFQMQRDTSGVWVVVLPTIGTADQGLAGAADTQVGALRIITALEDQLKLADAGLDSPAFTMELTFDNHTKHVLQVGNLTPTNSGYYVRWDASKLYVISQSGIDAILNLLVTPPFPSTITPLPTIEQTVTGTPAIGTPATSMVSTPTP